MSKNFDDFMKQCNNKDWTEVASHAIRQTNLQDRNEILFRANIEVTMTMLREYHNWLNS